MRQLLVVLLTAAAAVVVSAACPPRAFDSVKDFDIKKYVSAPWYIQEQVSQDPLPPSYKAVLDQLVCKPLRLFCGIHPGSCTHCNMH
jgi:hypothetical protein